MYFIFMYFLLEKNAVEKSEVVFVIIWCYAKRMIWDYSLPKPGEGKGGVEKFWKQSRSTPSVSPPSWGRISLFADKIVFKENTLYFVILRNISYYLIVCTENTHQGFSAYNRLANSSSGNNWHAGINEQVEIYDIGTWWLPHAPLGILGKARQVPMYLRWLYTNKKIRNCQAFLLFFLPAQSPRCH